MPPWMTCLRGWPRPFHTFISLELLYQTGSGTTFAVGTVAAVARVGSLIMTRVAKKSVLNTCTLYDVIE